MEIWWTTTLGALVKNWHKEKNEWLWMIEFWHPYCQLQYVQYIYVNLCLTCQRFKVLPCTIQWFTPPVYMYCRFSVPKSLHINWSWQGWIGFNGIFVPCFIFGIVMYCNDGLQCMYWQYTLYSFFQSDQYCLFVYSYCFHRLILVQCLFCLWHI